MGVDVSNASERLNDDLDGGTLPEDLVFLKPPPGTPKTGNDSPTSGNGNTDV